MINAQISTKGLVGHWLFTGNANDLSENFLNGTVNGATLTTDRYGIANNAYYFDGIDDYIDFGNSSILNPSDSISISLWFNLDELTTPPAFLLERYVSTGGSSYGVAISEDSLIFLLNNGYNGLSDENEMKLTLAHNYEIGQWAMITCTYGGEYLKIYLDGNLLGTLEGSFSLEQNDWTTICGLDIDNGSVNQQIKGKIDDIRIYNIELSDSEVSELFLEETNSICMVADYPFSGSAVDISGNENNGTVFGATLTTDRFGNSNSAYYFDGVDDYIDFGNSSSLNPSNNIAVSLWCNLDELTTPPAFLLERYVSTGGSSYGVAISEDSLIFVLNNGYNGLSDSNEMKLTVSHNYEAGQWSMITCTYDGEYLKTYLDGALLGSVEGSFSLEQNDWTTICGLDIDNGSVNQQIKGKIDDIKLFQCPLDLIEIQNLYNEGVTSSQSIEIVKYTVKVYPNPTSDIINISFEENYQITNNYTIKIINTQLQTIFENEINTQESQINISEFGSTGLYFIQIFDDKQNLFDVRKIILE